MRSLFCCFLFLVSNAYSATIALNNFNVAEDNAHSIIDSNGDFITTADGFKGAIGYFTITDSAISTSFSGGDLVALSNGFSQFGSNFLVDNFVSGVFTAAAPELTQSTEPPSTFGGQSIYAVFYKGSSLASATELLVAKLNVAFPTDPIGLPALNADAYLRPSGVTSLVVGNVGPSFDRFSAGAISSYQLSAVPEPSRALLLLGGVFGLMMRRRRM